MPAASDPASGATTLPVTFRPLGVRFAVVVLGLLLVGVCAVIWFAFPADVRAQFTFPQRLTLVGIFLVLAVAGHALARCRVEAREDGLRVVNGYRSRRYAWPQVLRVTLSPGAPWAVLDLADGTSTPAMGIQGSDGARATKQVRRLQSILGEYSSPGRDG